MILLINVVPELTRRQINHNLIVINCRKIYIVPSIIVHDVRQKKYGSWIAGSLVTLVAGYLSYASLSSPKHAVVPVVKKEQSANNQYDARISRTLNDLISSIRQQRSQRDDYASVPANEYSIEDTFPVDEDSDINDLGDLFHNDCEGICIYMKDSNNSITKVKS